MQLLKALTIFSFVTTGLAAAISGFDAHGNLDLFPRAACVGPHGCQQKVRIFSYNLLNRNKLTLLNSAGAKAGKMAFALTWCECRIDLISGRTRADWKYIGTASALMTKDMNIGLVMGLTDILSWFKMRIFRMKNGARERFPEGRELVDKCAHSL